MYKYITHVYIIYIHSKLGTFRQSHIFKNRMLIILTVLTKLDVYLYLIVYWSEFNKLVTLKIVCFRIVQKNTIGNVCYILFFYRE